ncbi:MAG TPA: metallophosphoesterase family protein [Opitutaceae bacterium]
MRIAILADIHGNLPALEAVLADVSREKVDRIFVAGDVVVGSPDSAACWDRVRALGCPVLRGNHERYVFDLHTERAAPEWHSIRFGPVQYAAAQLGEARRREMAALPITHQFSDIPEILFVHGSSRSDNDLIFPYTTDEAIAPMFPASAPEWIVRGHNHFSSVRLWEHRKIVTVGSIGLPLDGTPDAQFTILEKRGNGTWRVIHRNVRYDVNATLKRFRETDYLEKAGPMARLFMREVQTAAFQIVPFLKFYQQRLAEKPEWPLADAVDAFLPEAVR